MAKRVAKKTTRKTPAKKATAKKQADPVLVSVDADPTSNTKLVFGIIVEVNGTEVPISTDNIKDYQTKGFDFELPQPIHLGSFKDLFAWLKDNFGVEVPSADNLPSPLNDMVNALTELVFTVEQLAFHIPGKQSPATDKRTYKLRMAAAWSEAKEIIPGLKVLKLKGGVFGVTNMPNTQTPDKAVTISKA